jgi:hypothetical protein
MKNPSVTDFLQDMGDIADALQNGEGCIVCALDVMKGIAIKFISETVIARAEHGLPPLTFDCNAIPSNDDTRFDS